MCLRVPGCVPGCVPASACVRIKSMPSAMQALSTGIILRSDSVQIAFRWAHLAPFGCTHQSLKPSRSKRMWYIDANLISWAGWGEVRVGRGAGGARDGISDVRRRKSMRAVCDHEWKRRAIDGMHAPVRIRVCVCVRVCVCACAFACVHSHALCICVCACIRVQASHVITGRQLQREVQLEIDRVHHL